MWYCQPGQLPNHVRAGSMELKRDQTKLVWCWPITKGTHYHYQWPLRHSLKEAIHLKSQGCVFFFSCVLDVLFLIPCSWNCFVQYLKFKREVLILCIYSPLSFFFSYSPGGIWDLCFIFWLYKLPRAFYYHIK